MPLNRNKKGFTLVELLVVIAIIGLLASIVLVSLGSVRAKSRDTKRISDLHQIALALELYYDDKGYYPQSSCGWDCNGYRFSYDSSWNNLANDLSPYISVLPKDPVNSSCPPWGNNCHSYSYGNVGRNIYSPQYDLTTQLESNHPQRCGLKCYKWYFSNEPWCTACGGSYNNQIYEASPL